IKKKTKNMLTRKPYRPVTQELNKFSHLAHRLCRDYNLTTDEDTVERGMIIDRLFPQHADGIYLQGPIHIDYGRFTKIGKNFYANFNFTILDTCPVTIGNNVMRSEEHTSELQSRFDLVCRLLLEKKKTE